MDFVFGLHRSQQFNVREFIQQNFQSSIDYLDVKGSQQNFKPIPVTMENMSMLGEFKPIKEFELILKYVM